MDWKSRIFYAVPDHNTPVAGIRPSYFYLHREAESRNGYDICTCNSEAIVNCLREGAFLCRVIFSDYTTEDAVCFSKFVDNRMNGLICLLSDEDGIKSAVKYYDFTDGVSMYTDEEEYLKLLGKYKSLKA